jgi:hypothetical protein
VNGRELISGLGSAFFFVSRAALEALIVIMVQSLIYRGGPK